MSRQSAAASASTKASASPSASPGVRLDKWLWAARFFKTRSLATEDIEHGRVQVNGQSAKPSKDVRVGDLISLRQREQPTPRVVTVRGLSSVRGPAPVAQQLYEETAESVLNRETWLKQRPYAQDPAASMTQGRPTKHDRRQLDALNGPEPVPWHRWSASLDE